MNTVLPQVIPNPLVNWFFEKPSNWQECLQKLREIMRETKLNEGLTYGKPTYYNYPENQKICLLHTFKDYAAILFYKGALMNNPDNLLVQQTVNVQSARQLRFKNLDEIVKKENQIKDYIQEAIKVEKSGKKVIKKTPEDLIFPDEFVSKLDEISGLYEAFNGLTEGRQKGYYLYFTSAKLAKTRGERVAKSIPYIMRGKGMMMGGKFED
jgi:uncharacterized protein YdeI (YjbR/CyaY-like superfamily)